MPETPSTPPALGPARTQRRRAWDAAYALTLLFLTVLYVRPLYLAEQPALTDFGAQLIMADAWTRYDEVPQFAEYFVREERYLPALLPARFCALLYPWVSPTRALTLFTALGMLNTVLGAFLLARAYDRSRWLVLFCLPGLWGGMLALGLLNYCGTYGLMLESAALGRLAARDPRTRLLLGLAAVNVAAFFMHGLGYLLVVMLGGLSWLTSLPSLASLRRARTWAGALALLPGALLWLSWWRGVEADPSTLGMSMSELLRDHASWRTPGAQLEWLVHQGHDLLVDGTDTLLGVGLGCCWLALLCADTGREVAGDGERQAAAPETRLGAHSLLVLVLALGILMFALPATIRGTGINSRLVTPFLFLAALLPRARPRDGWGALPLALGVALITAYGVHLGSSMVRFEAEELVPLRALVDRVPEGSAVDCLGVCDHRDAAVFVRRPLCSICNGMVQTRRDGFSGGGFAQHPWNAIRYRPGVSYASARAQRWWTSANLRRWDYVIVRGATLATPPPTLLRVQHSAPVAPGAGEWSLYRVLPAVPPTESP